MTDAGTESQKALERFVWSRSKFARLSTPAVTQSFCPAAGNRPHSFAAITASGSRAFTSSGPRPACHVGFVTISPIDWKQLDL